MEGEDLWAEPEKWGSRGRDRGGKKGVREREEKRMDFQLIDLSSPGKFSVATTPPISKTQYPLSLSLSFCFLFFPNMSCWATARGAELRHQKVHFKINMEKFKREGLGSLLGL